MKTFKRCVTVAVLILLNQIISYAQSSVDVTVSDPIQNKSNFSQFIPLEDGSTIRVRMEGFSNKSIILEKLDSQFKIIKEKWYKAAEYKREDPVYTRFVRMVNKVYAFGYQKDGEITNTIVAEVNQNTLELFKKKKLFQSFRKESSYRCSSANSKYAAFLYSSGIRVYNHKLELISSVNNDWEPFDDELRSYEVLLTNSGNVCWLQSDQDGKSLVTLIKNQIQKISLPIKSNLKSCHISLVNNNQVAFYGVLGKKVQKNQIVMPIKNGVLSGMATIGYYASVYNLEDLSLDREYKTTFNNKFMAEGLTTKEHKQYMRKTKNGNSITPYDLMSNQLIPFKGGFYLLLEEQFKYKTFTGEVSPFIMYGEISILKLDSLFHLVNFVKIYKRQTTQQPRFSFAVKNAESPMYAVSKVKGGLFFVINDGALNRNNSPEVYDIGGANPIKFSKLVGVFLNDELTLSKQLLGDGIVPLRQPINFLYRSYVESGRVILNVGNFGKEFVIECTFPK